MVEDTAHTINKKVGWLLHGQEAILVPDFNTKCQCQILGEGIGFLPEYMARDAVEDGLLVTRRINNPRPGFAHVACHTTCSDRPGHTLDQTAVWPPGCTDRDIQ